MRTHAGLHVIHKSQPKLALSQPIKKTKVFYAGGGLLVEFIHMRTPWTLSTLEAVIFSALVLGLSGVALWATVIL
jgi:hypothetical protein